MNIFADLHHGDLYYSLQLLFEKRLGYNIYRPIGTEWFTKGYWEIAAPYGNAPDTIKQYLGIGSMVWNPYKNLNGNYVLEDGIYHVYDPVHEVHNKAITIEQFKNMDIDIIVASLPAHWVVYKKLRDTYKPKAKLICHMGNMWLNALNHIQGNNLMASTSPFITHGINSVFYHQEFSLETFRYDPPNLNSAQKNINSFVILLPQSDEYYLAKKNLPEFNFRAYGPGCPDGTITGLRNIAKIMQESTFGWHIKPGGDGFGHIIHNWYACGRPIITNCSDYAGKLAGELLIDDKTCINLEAGSISKNMERIRYWSEPENHMEMCKNAYNRFKEIVDFDNEIKKINEFLNRLA